MKKNAGSLRLDLAQYRELQAFAQFGSDLDKATQDKLTRGERLVEILKQGQYAPARVEDQIMIIYAGTSGGLDDLPAKKVGEFEKAFIAFVNDSHPGIGDEIKGAKKDIPDDVKQKLNDAIAAVKAQIS